MKRGENPMKRSNDERGRGRCGSFESSGRKIAYTGLASEHNKGDERSFIRGKKFCPVFCRLELPPRRQGKSSFVPGMNMHGTERFSNGGGNIDIVF